MSVAENLKDAMIEDIKQIKAYQWVFLVLNVIFNGVITIFSVALLIPYVVELIIRSLADDDVTTRMFLMDLLSNLPYLVLFTLPALIISVLVPMYRRPWFLVVYRIVQSFVGWLIIAVGAATLMEAVRSLLNTWAQNGEIWYTSFVSIVAGFIFILQGTGMFTTVVLSNILFHYFIGKSYSEENVEKGRNFFAKVIAATLNIIEVVILVALTVYSGFHVYLIASDDRPVSDSGNLIAEIVIFCVFCVCALISVITSGGGAVLYIGTIFIEKTKILYPAILFGVNLAECFVFALTYAIIVITLVVVAWIKSGNNDPADPHPRMDFFDPMWAILAVCLWKVLLSVSGVEVVFSNFRLEKSGDFVSKPKSGSKKKEDDVDFSV